MNFNFIDILNTIAIFQLMVFVFFLFQKRTHRPSNIILAIFLISQIFILLNYEFFQFSEILHSISLHFNFIGLPFLFLAAPSFYLYVRSLAYSDFELKKKDMAYTIPFCIVVLFFVFTYHIYSAETKREFITSGIFSLRLFWICFNGAMFIQLFAYNIAALIELRKYRSFIKQQYSSIHNINLSWLSFVLYGFLFAWLTSLLEFIASMYFIQFSNILTLLNFLSFFIFFNIIFYKALIQPEIFSGIEEKPKYLSSTLTNSEAEKYKALLSSHMETTKPYLNPTISLKDLAEQLSIPPRHLSQVINEHTKKNFYDFVKQYRIEEAKRQLNNPAFKKTVLEVLYEVGFNSKSSFNTAFKRHLGMTPTRYRKHHAPN